MNPTITRTPYQQARFDLEVVEAKQRTLKNIGIAIALLAFVFLSLLFSGCAGNPGLTAGMVRIGTADAVSVGLIKSPQSRPYLTAAKEVICSVANSTNVLPSDVVSALDGATNVVNLKTPEAVLIINSVIGVYNLAYTSISQTNTTTQALSPYLHGVCDGMGDGLGSPRARRALPPHVR